MKNQKQLKLHSAIYNSKMEFGGELLKRARNRTRRPFSSKDTMHMVLKSSVATGKYSFGSNKNLKRVNAIVEQHCVKYGVKLIKYSNNFNHLHLHLKFSSHALYLRFVRSLTASLALAVTGASKLNSLNSILGKRKFWDYRPFTRVVRSLRGFRTMQDYVRLNQLEANGIVPKRDSRLNGLQDDERRYFRFNEKRKFKPTGKTPRAHSEQHLLFF